MKKNKKWIWKPSMPPFKWVPDPKKHMYASFLKSGVRLLGYILLPFNLYLAMGVLLISEIIGIIEELV